MSIDGAVSQQWDAAPGFFLHVFDLPAGHYRGAARSQRSRFNPQPRPGTAAIPTAIEQFDLQTPRRRCGASTRDGRKPSTVLPPACGDGPASAPRSHCRAAARGAANVDVDSPLRYFDKRHWFARAPTIAK